MRGMEMMLGNVLKSLGVNPDEIMDVANKVQAYIANSEEQQQIILRRLERIEKMQETLCREKGLPVPALVGELQDG